MENSPIDTSVLAPVPIKFYGVSLRKLIIFNVLTCRFYTIYWFCKNWLMVREVEQEDILPIARGLFSIFFCIELFEKIFLRVKIEKKQVLSARGLGWLYIFLSLTGAVISRINFMPPIAHLLALLILVSTTLPLIYVQRAINLNNKNLDSSFEPENNFSGKEKVVLAVGSVFFALLIIGYIAE